MGVLALTDDTDPFAQASPGASASVSPSIAGPPDAATLPIVQPPVRPTEPVKFTLVAAGDVLPHGPVDASARTASGYDFTPLMAGVEPYIAGADLAICHMETPVAPDGSKPSGYPVFGAPKQLVANLKAVGWDGCSTASNHSVDRAYPGIAATLDAFEAQGLGHAGTARTESESTQTQFYNVVKGSRVIKVAQVSFAYGLNGLHKPAGKSWSVNTFDADAADATPIIDAAKAARAAGADVVVASVHCCVEYRTLPTAAQERIAQQIAASGAVDLYIGHHAHVPQPIVSLEGGPNGDGMWVAYGLGNFLSNQDQACCVAETSSGVLLTATFTVSPDDRVDVGVEWTPITVDRLDHHAMHVLTDIPTGSRQLSAAEVKARLARVTSAVGPAAPERTEPATKFADYMWASDRAP